MILCLAVLVEHRLVTDTDRHRRKAILRYSITSRGKIEVVVDIGLPTHISMLLRACLILAHVEIFYTL